METTLAAQPDTVQARASSSRGLPSDITARTRAKTVASNKTENVPGDDLKYCMFSDTMHKKKVTKDLRIISVLDHNKNPMLVVGHYWCSTCRKKSPKDFKFVTPQDNNPSGKNILSAEKVPDVDGAHELEFVPGAVENVQAVENSGQEKCCFYSETVHKQKITLGLIRITDDHKDNPILMTMVGQYLCGTCYCNAQENASNIADENPGGFDLNLQSSLVPDVLYERENTNATDQGPAECPFSELGVCIDDFVSVRSLNTDEIYTFSWNSGLWKLDGNSSICKFHYEEFVGKYKEGKPTFNNSCCDPFDSHRKVVKKPLRNVTLSLVSVAKEKNVHLVFGNKICYHCCYRVTENHPKEETPDVSWDQSSSSSSLLSPAVRKEKAANALSKLGVPVVENPSRYLAGRIEYGKRKLAEATEEVQKKISRILNIKPDQILPETHQKAHDMDLLMLDIKNKLATASKSEKYQLLTLVPLSMPVLNATQFFGVSRSLFERARAIKVQHGILSFPQFTRTSTVLDSTKQLVVKFYCADEKSKVLPGIKDCVSIAKNVYEQKRLLLLTVGELYAVFKELNPNLKVGHSIFCTLRPKWCVFPRSSGTHIVCVCQIHEDFKLILNALKIKEHYRDLIGSLVCNNESRSCMLRLCENCPSNAQILDQLRKLVCDSMELTEDLADESDLFDEEIKYHQWKSTDRSELVDLVASRYDILNIAVSQLVNLIPHDFIAQKQAQYVKDFKEDMPPTEIKILMDFAMNFSCTYHKETQSYHFNKSQVTLHPVVLYHKTEEEQEVKTDCICYISDDLSHDVGLVKAFQRKTMNFVRSKFPNITQVEYITDGSGSQYKNKFSFYNLCQHEKEFGLPARHSFFATSHGKALCDAMAGNIKRLLVNKSLQRPENDPINSAQKVYECLKSHKIAEKYSFIFVTKEEAEIERSVQPSNDQLVTVPGTRTFHCFVPLSENTIGCRRLSSDEGFSLKHCLVKLPQHQPAPSYEAGVYIVVKAVGRRHVAFLSDINAEEQEAEVATLQPRIPSTSGVYRWRENLETFIVPLPHIVCSVTLCELGNNSFKFTDSDIALLKQKGVLKK